MKKLILPILLLMMYIPIYVNAESMKATDFIKKIVTDNGGNENSINPIGNTGLSYDGTKDNNIRYIGTDPNNYIYYNCDNYLEPSNDSCELWRIIGIFGDNIKIVRNESIGYYSYDATNLDWGTNQWGKTSNFTGASLMLELNNEYYNNSFQQQWFNSFNGSKTNPPLVGIKNEHNRKMIEEYNWITTRVNRPASKSTIYEYYNDERGNIDAPLEVGQDLIERSNIWTGKIGLMYQSDAVFSCSGSSNYSRMECISRINESNWNSYTSSGVYMIGECTKNSWIFGVTDDSFNTWNDPQWEWALSPAPYDNDSVTDIRPYGYLGSDGAARGKRVRPALYLLDSINYISGDGTKDNPYIFDYNNSISIIDNNEVLGAIRFNREDFSSYRYGEKVVVKIEPKNGYEIKSIDIFDKLNNKIEFKKISSAEYEFIMPDSDVVITPVYRKIELINVPDILKNPNTGTGISIIILFMLIISSITYITMKRKKINYFK